MLTEELKLLMFESLHKLFCDEPADKASSSTVRAALDMQPAVTETPGPLGFGRTVEHPQAWQEDLLATHRAYLGYYGSSCYGLWCVENGSALILQIAEDTCPDIIFLLKLRRDSHA